SYFQRQIALMKKELLAAASGRGLAAPRSRTPKKTRHYNCRTASCRQLAGRDLSGLARANPLELVVTPAFPESQKLTLRELPSDAASRFRIKKRSSKDPPSA